MIRYVLNTLGSFRSALAVGVGLPFLVAAGAYAQAPAPEATTERVIVTGSYIPTSETESALPVTVYTAEVLRKQGANTPVEGLRQLPSFIGNSSTENDSNGGDGTATINLRALGPENTLILVNGRRTFNFLDINLIPLGAISRTEVLKDGASSVYGSDGVAGVVNFILLNGPGEKPYEGAELFALYGNTTDTDAHIRQVYLRGGVTGLDGKVAIAVAGEYYSRANLFAHDREISNSDDYTANPGNAFNLPGKGWGGFNNNSPTFSGRVAVATAGSSLGGPTGQLTLINQGSNQASPGAYRQFEANNLALDPDRFNFLAFAPAIPAIEKAMYYITGQYKVFGDNLILYGDLMYSKAKQQNALAGSPVAITNNVQNSTNGLAEARASSFNPFGNNLVQLRYRTEQELANRNDFYDKDSWRYVGGARGDFNFKDNAFISHFGYDTGLVYERFDEQTIITGDARRSYLRSLIAPVGFTNDTVPLVLPASGTFNPFIGQYAPIRGSAPTYNNTNSAAPHFQDGVPIGVGTYDNSRIANPAGDTNALGQGDGAAYIGHSYFHERDWLADGKINMHLFPKLWNGGIDLAGGYEHRNIQQTNVADVVIDSNDALGFNQGVSPKYRQEVDSWFWELGVPIVTSAMNVPFIRSLDLDIAWRREEFSDTNLKVIQGSPVGAAASFVNENPSENFGGSPRVSLRYQPIADVTLRASWGQSFRSPVPGELFAPIFQNFPGLNDPGLGTVQPPDGVWEGGSPTLIPETTDAYSAGIVWTPKFIPGFTMTVDVYQLFTSNLVLDPDSFAQVLLTTNVIDPDGCGLGVFGGGPARGITRFADGSLDCIDSGSGNAGKRFVEGIDVTANYVLPTPEQWGKFTLSGGYNHFFSWKAQPGIGSPTASFLGTFINSLPLAPGSIPWNKGYLRGEWEWRHFDFVSTVNYIGDYRDDTSHLLPIAYIGGTPITERNVDSYITLDMQLSYEWVKPEAAAPTYAKDAKDSKNVMQTAAETSSIWQRILWGTTMTVGVQNAFDRNPPTILIGVDGNDNYDTSLYSIRNRFWYVSLTKKF